MEHEMKRLMNHIGFAGLAAIALLATALAFSNFVVKPLQEKSQSLKETAGREARKGDASQSGDKVAAVYEFLQKDEDTTDWLAKLHGIGVATGVQLKSANYRTQKTEGRIVRYEIVLPVAGSYAQIRDFLKRSLAEIPVLSVDQLTLKREGKNEGAIQAEMRLTLHMVKS
jgi:Tfp pilus assembly protein PilO